MSTVTCPRCGNPAAEETPVLSGATGELVGTQLICTRCRHVRGPHATPEQPALESGYSKLRGLGLSDLEIEAVTGRKRPLKEGES